MGWGNNCFSPPVSSLQERPGEPLLSICKPGPRLGSEKCHHPQSPSSFSKPFGSVGSQHPAALRSAGVFFRNVSQPFQDSAPFLSARSLLAGYKSNLPLSRASSRAGERCLESPPGRSCVPRRVGELQDGTGGWVGSGDGDPPEAGGFGWLPPGSIGLSQMAPTSLWVVCGCG